MLRHGGLACSRMMVSPRVLPDEDLWLSDMANIVVLSHAAAYEGLSSAQHHRGFHDVLECGHQPHHLWIDEQEFSTNILSDVLRLHEEVVYCRRGEIEQQSK